MGLWSSFGDISWGYYLLISSHVLTVGIGKVTGWRGVVICY